MGAKGDKTRAQIVHAGRKLFARYGFSQVTMKDVAALCELSRGGLYRHFASTGEIFAEIINEEQEAAKLSLAHAKERGISAYLILKTFLENRMTLVTNREVSIENAISEYAANNEKGKELLVERAEASVKILSEIIETGVGEGVFQCEDVKNTARHIIWIIEGAAKHSALIPIDEEEIDIHINIIFKLLGVK